MIPHLVSECNLDSSVLCFTVNTFEYSIIILVYSCCWSTRLYLRYGAAYSTVFENDNTAINYGIV